MLRDKEAKSVCTWEPFMSSMDSSVLSGGEHVRLESLSFFAAPASQRTRNPLSDSSLGPRDRRADYLAGAHGAACVRALVSVRRRRLCCSVSAVGDPLRARYLLYPTLVWGADHTSRPRNWRIDDHTCTDRGGCRPVIHSNRKTLESLTCISESSVRSHTIITD